jgi:hypothetical protein
MICMSGWTVHLGLFEAQARVVGEGWRDVSDGIGEGFWRSRGWMDG